MTLKNILGRVTSYLDDGAGWSSLLIVPVFLLSWIKYPAAASRGAKLFSSSRCSESSGQGVRIASYNIHRAKGMDRIRDLGRIADNLKGVDLAALQEVSGPQVWGGENQASQLARRLVLGWVFAATRYRAFKPDVGNGLLSRLPVTDWQVQPLPTTVGSTRNLVSGTLWFEGSAVTLLATHIDRGPDRGRQLIFVLEQFRMHRHAILLGDLNTRRDQSPLHEFLLENPDSDAIFRAGGKNPADRIDWILSRGVIVGQGGALPPGASDHPLYWVEFQGLSAAK